METPSEDVAVIGGVDSPTDIYVEDADHMPVTEALRKTSLLRTHRLRKFRRQMYRRKKSGHRRCRKHCTGNSRTNAGGKYPRRTETPDSTEPAPDGTDGFTDGNTDPAPAPDTTEPEDPAETPVPTVTAAPSETPVPTDTRFLPIRPFPQRRPPLEAERLRSLYRFFGVERSD